MDPGEVVPSPQLMVALKPLAGSTPLSWVKVATWKFVRVRDFVEIGDETTGATSLNEVTAVAALLLELGSGLVPETETELLAAPSSMDCTVTVAVTVEPAATVPTLKVTTPP